MALCHLAIAQRTITGTVTSADTGEPLIGANVVVTGTSTGTITDVDGSYSLEVPEDAEELTFSYTGYAPQAVPIGTSDVVDVELAAGELLDEIVVVGYGTQRQKEVTSAIVSVKEEDFNQGNLNNAEQLLAGKVAGLTVSKPGGSATDNSVLRLRGLSTFGANAEPLVVVDGVINASLRNIDPYDIASIDVLKDASAAAIYGTRGSSGVIIVTTKSGNTVQRPQLEVRGYTVFENISRTPEVASVEDFLQAGGVDYGFSTDWLDEVTRTAQTNVVNAAFSANTGSTSYRVSLNYRDVEGVNRDQRLDRLNARINMTQNLLDDRLKLTGIVSFTRGNTEPGIDYVLRSALLWNPTAPVYVDGDPANGFFETREQDVFNSVAINAFDTRLNQTKQTLMNFKASYEPIPGLTLSGNYSYQVNSSLYGQHTNSQGWFNDGINFGGRAFRSTSDFNDELFELTASYRNNTGGLSYTVLGGYSYQEQGIETFNVSNTNFITDGVTYNNIGIGRGLIDPAGPFAGLGSNKEENKLNSIFGRINVTIQDIYNLSASLRREASSRFGANNRWGNFWAVSGSVDLVNLMNVGGADLMKVRAGYGVTGNEPAQRYAFLETLGLQGQGYVNGEFTPAIGPSSNPNPDLKWEEKGEFNVGLDFAFFDYRLTGSLDYYNRSTDDLLNTISVPSPPNLFPSTLVNLGQLETNGFEATLNYKVLSNQDFNWDVGLIFDRNRTKLVRFNNLEAAEIFVENLGTPGFNNLLAIRIKEGDLIGNIMAPQFAGWNENGNALIIGADGNEKLAVEGLREDYIVAGNGLPDFSLNLTNSFTYRNFDLSFLWRGVFGHDLANLPAAKLGHPVRAGQFRYIVGEFFNPDDSDDSAWHTEFVEDASFLRLDNITLGYTLQLNPGSFARNLRVYVTGNNLVTITGYSGADPEPRLVGNTGILAPGLDRLNDYFPTRSVTMGANFTF